MPIARRSRRPLPDRPRHRRKPQRAAPVGARHVPAGPRCGAARRHRLGTGAHLPRDRPRAVVERRHHRRLDGAAALGRRDRGVGGRARPRAGRQRRRRGPAADPRRRRPPRPPGRAHPLRPRGDHRRDRPPRYRGGPLRSGADRRSTRPPSSAAHSLPPREAGRIAYNRCESWFGLGRTDRCRELIEETAPFFSRAFPARSLPRTSAQGALPAAGRRSRAGRRDRPPGRRSAWRRRQFL